MIDPTNLAAALTAYANSVNAGIADQAGRVTDQETRIAAQSAQLAVQSARIATQSAQLAVQSARIATIEARLAPPVLVKALLFSDEFEAPLDPARWDVKSRVANLSKTIFQPGNVTVHDGILDITASKDATGQWSGGEVQSLAAHAYTGPRYSEVRAQLPGGAGTWSAPLWEYDAPWGGLGIENDVCEQLGKEPTRYHVTVHNGDSEKFGKVIDTGVDLSASPHVYGCAMYPDRADYFFDGRPVATITQAESKLSAWRFTTTPTVCLVDLDMGGWGGTPTIAGPVRMRVEWVRVWSL